MLFTTTPKILTTLATFGAALSSTDDASPIITTTRVIVEGSKLTAIATDRYVAGILTLQLAEPADMDGETLFMTKQLTLAARTFGKCYSVTLEQHADEAGSTFSRITSVNDPGNAIGSRELTGNYPPVERLFPELGSDGHELGAEMFFKPSMIGRIGAIRFPGDRSPRDAQDSAWSFTGTHREGLKNSPMLATREQGDAMVRVLIQPNMRPTR